MSYKSRLQNRREVFNRRRRNFVSQLVVTCAAILFSMGISMYGIIIPLTVNANGKTHEQNETTEIQVNKEVSLDNDVRMTYGKIEIQPTENLNYALMAAAPVQIQVQMAAQHGDGVSEPKQAWNQVQQEELDNMLHNVSTKQADLNSLISTMEFKAGKDEINFDVGSGEYDATELGGVVPISFQIAKSMDIRSRSYVTAEELQAVLPENLGYLATMAVEMEEDGAGNAVFLMALMITEVGWQLDLAGSHNYFNWSTNGIDYYDFESLEQFQEYSTRRFVNDWTNPEFYNLPYEVQEITPTIVNAKYAMLEDGTPNTQWEELLTEIMVKLGRKLVQI